MNFRILFCVLLCLMWINQSQSKAEQPLTNSILEHQYDFGDISPRNMSPKLELLFYLEHYTYRYDLIIPLAKQIVENGGDINTEHENYPNSGFTPLYWATVKNQGPLIALFIQLGADPNTSTRNGPLWIQFVDQQALDRVHLFLDTGRVNVNATYANTPAICIIKRSPIYDYDKKRLIERMTAMGADPSQC